MNVVRFDPSRLDSDFVTKRRNRVTALVILLAAPAVVTMADLHWRTGFDAWKLLHLLLFTVLFILVAFGAAQGLIGFFLRRRGGDSCRIVASLDPDGEDRVLPVRTAVVMPIYHENVDRVMEGMRVMYESVAATGKLPECDFFLLSDSTDPNVWVAEEAAWLALAQQLNAHGRIFYRKRRASINKKAGNLADFCRRWGRLYRYMIVLDADSIMTGAATVKLVRLMERNRNVGIIQGVPLLANGETMLARLQQFASRLYGSISAAGLNYWQLSEANYWGHNAIIRIAPFIRHCSLPELPGDGPFGGRILSHDYVEAALMRRANWEVWLATDMEGNFEECPANVIDLAKRDRRWLQGNLQHARLVVARGFHTVNRIHFALGILSYVASPLWLAFLLVSTVIAYRVTKSGLTLPPVSSFATYIHWSYSAQALCLFIYTIALLFLPKVIAAIDLRSHPEELAAFGGWNKLLPGILLETVTFTLLAPVLMLFHTQFIILTLLRQSISWGTQRRGRDGESAWAETISTHAMHTLIGVVGAWVVYKIDPLVALWMSPILAGLILSIPLSYFTGSLAVGSALQQRGIFRTPEESQPPPELVNLAQTLSARQAGPVPRPELALHYGFLQAVLDPYVNAVHVSLLRTKDDPAPANEARFAILREKLLREGPASLAPQDRLALLMDVDSMNALHNDVWAAPASQLAGWWKLALKHYEVVAPVPQTAFSQ
jgi:membrane glycosyltransferase